MFRSPGMLVKTATTVDVLSGGRLTFGIGAGWYEREALGLGIAFPNRRERFARLEETVRIARQLWADDQAPFEGRFATLSEPIIRPQPLSLPHPPIMIGGNGERRTLRLVARYADACNFLVLEPHEVRAKLAVLREHCDAVGRDMAEIEITALDEVDLRPGQMTPADVVARARAQADAGVQHLIVNMPDAWDVRHLELIGRDVIPTVGALAA
jgi:alkanesulfonate monooxygenase SsuD/methylene tetrahydromethanopterin reductase-like flavin-dependent oxidoreductase (luciferase family)